MKPILNNPTIEPTPEVLQSVMGENYENYLSFMTLVSKYGLITEWRYYNDGKSWLCKMMYKKKNIFWFSVWVDCFKTTFYFTEKEIENIGALSISEAIKSNFFMQKPIGKLIPMIIEVKSSEPLQDIDAVIGYKLSEK
ncbi:hypothetical protein BN938_0723 [Mucinivorans hirudinis]|uniref:DUF3788 family protein n=1 Tax=Mucinivorans hirudinis TaxID=1433126 RepID=A0A060RAN5_9BACT|nr:hypothetical protein BN938_0723 [Mucinivorans hirudinis]